MNLKGVITHVTKQVIGSKNVFLLQLSGQSAATLGCGQVECLYYRSRIHQYMPVSVECEIKNGYYVVNHIEPYFSTNLQVSKYMKFRLKGTGIGQKKVDALIDFYKDRIFTLSKEEFRKSLETEFPGKFSLKNINAFIDVWFLAPTISELEDFLVKYEVKYSSIEKINETYGESAIKKLKEDPYRECLIFDIKRQVAEEMAKDLKIDAFDKRRVSGLISYVLLSAASEGHTYITASELAKRLQKFTKKSVYHTDIPLVLIANEVSTNRSFVLDQNGFVALKCIYDEEINCAIRLKQIQREFVGNIKVSDARIKEIEAELRFKFAKEQKNAFHLLETGAVNILTGGPGTGKTTIINGIIRYYEKINPGKPILLCAPTGRAAKKLSEATGREAQTIHKMLEYQPFGDTEVVRNRNNPLEAGLIIVDETSMCDVSILSMLLNAVPSDCRLLFVGDENQLPSVGAGNCLHDMIASNLFCTYRLVQNFRSDGSILKNAKLVLDGKEPKSDESFEIHEVESDEAAYKIITAVMEKYYKTTDPFYLQMIEPSRKGAAGCDAINAYMHKWTHKNIGSTVSDDLMVDDKIMFIRNEYKDSDALYTNGEITTIKYLTEDEVTLYDGEEEKTLNRGVLSDARLCYSYTIHKSQGSENEMILIYLSGANNVKCMMNRNLLYTAITRAKKKVILIHSGDALESCIKNEYFIKRNTRLLEQLLVA